MNYPNTLEHQRIQERHVARVLGAMTTARLATNRAVEIRSSLEQAEAAVAHRTNELDHYKRSAGLRASPGDVLHLQVSIDLARDVVDTLRVDLDRAIGNQEYAVKDHARISAEAVLDEWREHRALIERTFIAAQEAHETGIAALGPEPAGAK